MRHCEAGASIWEWASTDRGRNPHLVLACAGDVPTLEVLAATMLLREALPDLRVRVVNVVDLMTLQPSSEHPHGLADEDFDAERLEPRRDELGRALLLETELRVGVDVAPPGGHLGVQGRDLFGGRHAVVRGAPGDDSGALVQPGSACRARATAAGSVSATNATPVRAPDRCASWLMRARPLRDA